MSVTYPLLGEILDEYTYLSIAPGRFTPRLPACLTDVINQLTREHSAQRIAASILSSSDDRRDIETIGRIWRDRKRSAWTRRFRIEEFRRTIAAFVASKILETKAGICIWTIGHLSNAALTVILEHRYYESPRNIRRNRYLLSSSHLKIEDQIIEEMIEMMGRYITLSSEARARWFSGGRTSNILDKATHSISMSLADLIKSQNPHQTFMRAATQATIEIDDSLNLSTS